VVHWVSHLVGGVEYGGEKVNGAASPALQKLRSGAPHSPGPLSPSQGAPWISISRSDARLAYSAGQESYRAYFTP